MPARSPTAHCSTGWSFTSWSPRHAEHWQAGRRPPRSTAHAAIRARSSGAAGLVGLPLDRPGHGAGGCSASYAASSRLGAQSRQDSATSSVTSSRSTWLSRTRTAGNAQFDAVMITSCSRTQNSETPDWSLTPCARITSTMPRLPRIPRPVEADSQASCKLTGYAESGRSRSSGVRTGGLSNSFTTVPSASSRWTSTQRVRVNASSPSPAQRCLTATA
jgi:hypothetical protein